MSYHVLPHKIFRFFAPKPAALLAALAIALSPVAALACACGCSNVGVSTLLPGAPGGTAFLQWDFLNQTTNWSGNHTAPSADNDDKKIRSNFIVAGGQYFFNEKWGVRAEVPVLERYLHTEEEGNAGVYQHTALGDIRLMGVYSGFSPDMSTGLIFGMKLPTGNHTYPHFDPDVQIGTGSTDIILGGYHRGQLTTDGAWNYFTQVLWQHEVATQDHYRPGAELNLAGGITYSGPHIGSVNVAPALQVLVSNRGRDGGTIGDHDNTGYTRVLVAPGVAFSYNVWTLYAGVEVAAFQHINGNQLIAPVGIKMVASYNF